MAEHGQDSFELKLLVDHREDLVGERTAMINRLRRHCHRLDPELDLPARGLDTPTRLAWPAEHLQAHHDGLVAELAGDGCGPPSAAKILAEPRA